MTSFINKRARHDYEILKTYEAGIKLTGTEIKSVRCGSCSINEAYIQIKENKCIIINMFIKKYDYGTYFNHEERRSRELLLHKEEINKLYSNVKEKSLTIIPLKAYFKKGLLKLEIALARGKKLHDKRESLKQRDLDREMKKIIKERYRY